MECLSTVLLILSSGNELLVLHEICQEACTDEDGVLAAWRVVHLDLDSIENISVASANFLDPHVLQLLLQSRREAGRHGRTTREINRRSERFPKIDVARGDRVKNHTRQTLLFHLKLRRVHQELWRLKTLATKHDCLSIRQFVLSVDDGRVLSNFTLFCGINGHIAQFFLDLANSLKVCTAVESVATDHKQLDQVLCDVATSQV